MADVDQTQTLSPEKKKKTFKIKKRIEDAQNFTKKEKKTTMLPQSDSRAMLSKNMTKIYNATNKSETEENEVNEKLKGPKSKALLESKPTFCVYDVQGPQLKINRRYLSFIVKTGLVATESVDVSNNGSTAIYYEWTRVEKSFLIASSLRDNEERFYCHHVIFKKNYELKFKTHAEKKCHKTRRDNFLQVFLPL